MTTDLPACISRGGRLGDSGHSSCPELGCALPPSLHFFFFPTLFATFSLQPDQEYIKSLYKARKTQQNPRHIFNGPPAMEQIETQASDLRFLAQAQVPLSNSPSVTYETPRPAPQGSPGSASFGGNSAAPGDSSTNKRKASDDGFASTKQTRSKRNRVRFTCPGSFTVWGGGATVVCVRAPPSPSPPVCVCVPSLCPNCAAAGNKAGKGRMRM